MAKRKTIIDYHTRAQIRKTIIKNLNMHQVNDSTVDDRLDDNA